MTWITIKRHAEITGYTEAAQRSKIADGTWLEGVVWRRAPDGRTLISQEGYELWVQGQVSAPQVKRRSRSTFDSAACAAGRS